MLALWAGASHAVLGFAGCLEIAALTPWAVIISYNKLEEVRESLLPEGDKEPKGFVHPPSPRPIQPCPGPSFCTHPLMPAHSEPLRSYGLSIPYALDERIPDYLVLVLAN